MSEFEPVRYNDGNSLLSGLLVRPDGIPRAAVAIYPTIMNTTPAVEAKARALADAGYLALICDFYGNAPTDFAQSRDWAADLRADTGVYRQRLHAGLEALRAYAGDLPMFAIGFCMGGQAALELARDGADVLAVTSFHGLLETGRKAAIGAIKARILVCHGDADPIVPRDHVISFWQEMDHAGANWHFHSYSGVKHGFTNPNPPPNSPAVDYDASADRQSWAAMLGLFDEVLG
ncbi:dienelactone hydrolase family protein [Erythrobacteraceae bacterium E2-1 Yellow Sea]|nr:dienelactone hydrolase family protein [Erythrobacteraceae bacterium E2-1 Yellow Sea]